jgi:hypothetical protein
VNDDLCIAVRPETVTAFKQRLTEFQEIVKFSVVGNPNGIGLIRHRLAPRSEINNRKPSVTDRNAVANKDAFPVWPTVGQTPRHTFDFVAFRR